MKALKFKNKYICDEDDVILATLSIREYLPESEMYAVYLERLFDNKKVSELREYISATDILQATTIIEAGMKASFKKQLEEKLHQCMLATDFTYRLSCELAQCREQSRVLEKSLDEERKRRWELEIEVDKLKESLQKLEESESESDETN